MGVEGFDGDVAGGDESEDIADAGEGSGSSSGEFRAGEGDGFGLFAEADEAELFYALAEGESVEGALDGVFLVELLGAGVLVVIGGNAAVGGAVVAVDEAAHGGTAVGELDGEGLFEVGSPAGGNRWSEGGVELEIAEEIDAFTLEVVAAGDAGLFGFAVEDAVGDGFDIAGGIEGPLADGLMSDVAEKEGIEALGRGFGEAGEFEAAGGEVAEGAGEEGFEFTGGPGVGGGAPGTGEASGCGGAGDRWCRNDMGR